MPIIEEGRLTDPDQREAFVTQVFAYRTLKDIERRASALQEFHKIYKLILMEHSPVHYQRLGRLVANEKKLPFNQLYLKYIEGFMEALRIPSTKKKRANVLQHVLGYLKKCADDADRKRSLETIDEYRRGLLPLMVPVTLLHHLVNKFSIEYLKEQRFFAPYPKELSLRSGL